MERWERRYITKQKSLTTDAATEVVNLPLSNILSGLLVRLAWTNGTTDSAATDVIDAVDKVQVIANGSHELFSLSGEELAKHAYFETGRRCPQYRHFGASAVQSCTFPVMFGRFLGDPELWLRCNDFTSLELKITYSPTISATVGFATGTGVLDVIGVMFYGGEPGIHQGYLRTTSQYAVTTAASGDAVIELPRQNDYRRLYAYCFETAIEDGVDVTELELSLNNGELVPYTGRWLDLQEQNEYELGIVPVESGVFAGVDNETIETRLGRILGFNTTVVHNFAATTDFPLYDISSIAGGTVTLAGILVEASATYAATALDAAARDIHWIGRGVGVGNAVCIPFDKMLTMDHVLRSADFDSVKLTLTQGAAGGALKVWLQELVRR